MIVSSFQTQYGIRIYSKDFLEMKWDEFKAIISGLGPETPLGRIVQIRAENDKNILKNFSKEQHRIRNEWKSRNVKKVSKSDITSVLDQLKTAFIQLAE